MESSSARDGKKWAESGQRIRHWNRRRIQSRFPEITLTSVKLHRGWLEKPRHTRENELGHECQQIAPACWPATLQPRWGAPGEDQALREVCRTSAV